MLEHARHFPSGGGHARDGHERVRVDLEHLVRTIVDDDVARGRATITGDEDTARELKPEDGGRLRLCEGSARARGRGEGRLRIKPALAKKRGEIPRVRRRRLADGAKFHYWPVRWR